MPYIKRNQNGEISSVSLTHQEGYQRCEEQDIEELDSYLERIEASEQNISGTDLPLVRVLEDLIDLLIDREVIRFTDLPEAAQQKLMNRRTLRTSLRAGLDLISDERDSVL